MLGMCLAMVAPAAESAPAVISKLNDKGQKVENGGFSEAFVATESVDGIEFTVDDPKSLNRLSLKFRSYDVEYNYNELVDYRRARMAEEAGTFDKAYEAYVKAVGSAKYQWVKEDALVRAAGTALQANKFNEALTAVAALEKEFPRSVRLDRALSVRGQAQVATGDAASAAKTFATLSAMAKEWGESAALWGAQGQAGLLAANKQYTEAAEVISKILTRMDPNKAKKLYVGLVLELAENQRAAGKPDDAVTSLRGVLYREVEGSLQARAHLALAQILATKPDAASLAAAFDQAALASVIKGAEPTVVSAAKTVALAVTDKLAKDPAVSAADKAEYQRSLSFF
jgi:tetratricopeptide (TPR) repeat protein